MSKDKISDYSQTANSNTDIGGINVDEGCAPSGINDAIRTLMKQLKDWQSGSQDVYIHPAGSASVPSITATGDTNTGIFFPAADTVGITTGGTERARVDSSGNLGLGVTPSAWATVTALQVKNAAFAGFSNSSYVASNAYYNAGWKYIASAAAARYEQGGGAHEWHVAGSGTAGNAITFTQAMTLNASGNLGIGVTSPAERLDIGASGSTKIIVRDTSDSDRGIYLASGTAATGVALVSTNTANRALGFATNDTERARIDSGGQFFVGITSSSGVLTGSSVNAGVMIGSGGYMAAQKNSDACAYWSKASGYTSGSYHQFWVNGSIVGSISTGGSTTSYNTSSDYRLKENIAPMTGALAKVALLKPVTYTWKSSGEADEGFIAHELQEVCPSAVTGEKDAVETYTDDEGNEQTRPVYQGIDTSFLVATLTAAIQEQQAIITQLQADVAALKGQA